MPQVLHVPVPLQLLEVVSVAVAEPVYVAVPVYVPVPVVVALPVVEVVIVALLALQEA